MQPHFHLAKWKNKNTHKKGKFAIIRSTKGHEPEERRSTLQGRGHKVIWNNFPGGQNDSNETVNDLCWSAEMLMNIKCIASYCSSHGEQNNNKKKQSMAPRQSSKKHWQNKKRDNTSVSSAGRSGHSVNLSSTWKLCKLWIEKQTFLGNSPTEEKKRCYVHKGTSVLGLKWQRKTYEGTPKTETRARGFQML